MHVSRLHLHQFRSHKDVVFEFNPQVTAIIGPNGSGKTNILEAIYTLCMGKSFRDGDDDLITYEQDWYRIEGNVDDVARELRYQPSNKGKQLIVDGTSKGRFTYRQQLPVVLFEPDDLLMIHGSPGARRRYIDDIIQKLYPHTRPLFTRYERAVTQRNNLLKQRQTPTQLKDNLFVWDISVAELGAKIIAERIAVIDALNAQLSDMYSRIAQRPHELRAHYVSPDQSQTESQLLAQLHARIHDDMRRGFTSVGPHRHDVNFSLNQKDAQHSASRGEVRSVLLSLKMIELQLLEEHSNTTPVFLCDDVFSELDHDRSIAVSGLANGRAQMILTSTSAPLKNKNSQLITLTN